MKRRSPEKAHKHSSCNIQIELESLLEYVFALNSAIVNISTAAQRGGTMPYIYVSLVRSSAGINISKHAVKFS